MSPNVPLNGLQERLGEKPPYHQPSNPALSQPPNPDRKIESLERTNNWNTKDLSWRITSDITAAACASGLVSPLITMIDRAIIENASSRRTLTASLLKSVTTLLTRPHTFVLSRPFLLISTVYFSTYITANTIDTLTSTFSSRSLPPETTTAGPAKFLGTTSVNMGLGLYKDSQFARMFGPLPVPGAPTVVRAIPKATYALFAVRDSLTIFASFNLPPLLAPLLPLSANLETHFSRASTAQFLAPAGIQLLSTPLHLWGLDLYNRPGAGVGWRSRVTKVGRDWVGSSFARMGRVVPAFGVGGVVNARVRRGMILNGEGDREEKG